MNIFAIRLKEALTAKNIKPSDLAKKTGIGKSSISDWLAGRYEAKQDKVYRIADALDINEAWLMGQEVPMKKNASTIDRIYKKLEPQRQAIVYQFAEQQLHEQQTQAEILSFPRRDEMTLAAHAGDPEKIFSKEEIEKIHDYLDEIDAKYQQSISSDKKED
ncbi:helix-turn-helix transcriptional regulator [Enterococcus faecalis]|uniref:helix-turn-helix domain-containing protein n=1 Tax=Enterococcus faecalis TaxID=1351 RepID=UPI00145C33A8|nr:helix-turn-helix transcriptional regulator [Enterococcus faecalis]NMP43559.1 helix-turn-helix transcriptional regulator [Enterococcus faecalis]